MSDVVLEGAACGRCGSSMDWEDCGSCDCGVYEYEGDWDEEPTYRTCLACNGTGGSWVCLSDREESNGATWCAGNPRPGRLHVPCSSPEFYKVIADGETTYERGAWASLIAEGAAE